VILDPGDYTPEDQPITLKRWFPANVTLPDGSHLENVLAIATRTRLYVWTRRPGAPRDVALAYIADHTTEAADIRVMAALSSGDTRIQIGDDAYVTIRRHKGCGCSDPLKTFQPWTPERSGT
jgi:hypothetical protein